MALARLSMKLGKAGKAAAHAAYIAREAQYAHRLQNGERLEAKETGNLPAWAEAEPNLFWQAADRHERANGTTYREMEIALPRELTPAQRLALVRSFVARELGARHAYQWAIHNPKAADGDEQPHVHLMFSERRADGIERDPERYFRRHDPKAPEKGGARKGYGPYGGEYLSRAERVAHLKGLRQRWEIACNAALADAGHAERIDMRSHAERGLTAPPERKQLPSQWRQPETRAAVLAFRQARAERAEAQAAVNRTLPNPGAAIIQLDAERRRRAEAAERQRQAEEAALLALKNAKTALLAEIPTWTDAGVLEYADRVMAQNRTTAERRASIHRDLTHTLIHDVTRTGHPPTSLPAELFEAAADDCLGPMVARCRQARAERERQAEEAEAERRAERQRQAEAEERRIRQAEATRQAEAAEAERQRQRQAEAEHQRLLAIDLPALLARRDELKIQAQHHLVPTAQELVERWAGVAEARYRLDYATHRLADLEAEDARWKAAHPLGSRLGHLPGLRGPERRELDGRLRAARQERQQAEDALDAARRQAVSHLPHAKAKIRELQDANARIPELQRQIERLDQEITAATAAQAGARSRRERLLSQPTDAAAPANQSQPDGEPRSSSTPAPEPSTAPPASAPAPAVSTSPTPPPRPKPRHPAPGG